MYIEGLVDRFTKGYNMSRLVYYEVHSDLKESGDAETSSA